MDKKEKVQAIKNADALCRELTAVIEKIGINSGSFASWDKQVLIDARMALRIGIGELEKL